MPSTKISLILFLCLLGLYSETVKSENCGTDDASCGGSVSSIVTQDFFNNIVNQAGNGCPGKRFYTHKSFIAAANSFPNFTHSVTRREIATMFAHLTHETRHFCYIIKKKRRKSHPRCDPSEERSNFGCLKPPSSKGYLGRGRAQSLSPDRLRQSELVGSNPTVTFKTGLQHWMNSVRPVLNQGFGATIRAINEKECKGGDSGAVNARIGYYRAYCGQLGVDPGPNLSC